MARLLVGVWGSPTQERAGDAAMRTVTAQALAIMQEGEGHHCPAAVLRGKQDENTITQSRPRSVLIKIQMRADFCAFDINRFAQGPVIRIIAIIPNPVPGTKAVPT
jgi:hypothetical protein